MVRYANHIRYRPNKPRNGVSNLRTARAGVGKDTAVTNGADASGEVRQTRFIFRVAPSFLLISITTNIFAFTGHDFKHIVHDMFLDLGCLGLWSFTFQCHASCIFTNYSQERTGYRERGPMSLLRRRSYARPRSALLRRLSQFLPWRLP